jgi:hypothetical protein
VNRPSAGPVPRTALKAGLQKIGEQLTADWSKKAGADGEAAIAAYKKLGDRYRARVESGVRSPDSAFRGEAARASGSTYRQESPGRSLIPPPECPYNVYGTMAKIFYEGASEDQV